MASNSPQEILTNVLSHCRIYYRFVERPMDDTFLYIKRSQFSDEVAEFPLNLLDLLRIHRVSQGFIGSPTKLKNVL